MKNVMADTDMRSSIASTGTEKPKVEEEDQSRKKK
jgi:uncharacterized protein YqfA (UPF0365 family)